jgi:hypothetical protein
MAPFFSLLPSLPSSYVAYPRGFSSITSVSAVCLDILGITILWDRFSVTCFFHLVQKTGFYHVLERVGRRPKPKSFDLIVSDLLFFFQTVNYH